MKGILFDLDGTLLDTLDDLTAAVNVALGEFGHPQRTRREVRGFVGNGVRRLMEQVVPPGLREEDFEACFQAMRAYYADHNNVHTAPYPGVVDMLKTLKGRGIPMALVSNKPDGPVADLARLHFPGIFDCTVGDSPLRARKPAPDMPLYALERLGLSPEEAVYVGDSEVDVRTARSAGVPIAAVTWGFRDRDLLEGLQPDWLVDNTEELLALF